MIYTDTATDWGKDGIPPLCLNQTSDRSTSNWVADHQRILIAVYLCFTFSFFYGSLRLLLHNGQNQERFNSVWFQLLSVQLSGLVVQWKSPNLRILKVFPCHGPGVENGGVKRKSVAGSTGPQQWKYRHWRLSLRSSADPSFFSNKGKIWKLTKLSVRFFNCFSRFGLRLKSNRTNRCQHRIIQLDIQSSVGMRSDAYDHAYRFFFPGTKDSRA